MSTPFDPHSPMTITDARRHIYDIINFVLENDGEIFRVIGRAGAAVIVSALAWHSLHESLYVFADPVNSRAVHESINAHMRGEPGQRMNPLTLSPDENPFFWL